MKNGAAWVNPFPTRISADGSLTDLRIGQSSISALAILPTITGADHIWRSLLALGPLGNSRLHSGNECLSLASNPSRFLFRRIWSWIVTAPYLSPDDTAEAIPVRRELVFLRRA